MTQQSARQPGRFVKLTTVGDITAGNVLAARLMAEGIEVRVHSAAFGPYPVTVGNMAEAEIWVMSHHVEDASSILLDAEVKDALFDADPDVDRVERHQPFDMQIIALVLGALLTGLFVLAVLRVY